MNILVRIRSRTSWKSLLRRLSFGWSAGSCPSFGPQALGNHHGFCHCQWTGRQSQADFGSYHWKSWWLVAILNDLEPGMFSLLMRSTVFLCRLKKCFTAPWKILYRHYDWRWREQPECPSGPSSFHFDWATTRAGMLSNPLRSALELRGIWNTTSKMIWQRLSSGPLRSLRWKLPTKPLKSFLFVVGDSPIANRLLKRVRDFAQIMGDSLIDDTITDKALSMLDVDHEGLDYVDQKILHHDWDVRRWPGWPWDPIGQYCRRAGDCRRYVWALPDSERFYHADPDRARGDPQSLWTPGLSYNGD